MRLSEVATKSTRHFLKCFRQIRKRGSAGNFNCGQEKHLFAATYSENNLIDSYRVYLS